MEFLLEILMEIFLEGFMEGFLSLYKAFIPEKRLSQKGRKVVVLLSVLLSLGMLIGLVVGILMLGESGGTNPWGWVLVAAGVVYLVTGITLKIVFRKKKRGGERDV